MLVNGNRIAELLFDPGSEDVRGLQWLLTLDAAFSRMSPQSACAHRLEDLAE